MAVNLKKDSGELQIDVVANRKTWKEEQEKAFKKLSASLSLKGFRKGKVPVDMARKNISEQNILNEAIKEMLNILVKKASKEIPKDTMVLDSPSYKIQKISNVELEVTFLYPIYPEFTIGDYKKLDVKYVEEKVEAQNVDDEVKNLVNMKTTYEKKDGVIKKGDFALFDFEGFIDKKPFEKGKAKNHRLEIGSNQFIPGFEEQMIGLKADDEKKIKVIFPKDYQDEKMQNKEAIFKIKINEVQIKKVPQLSDKFIQELKIPNVNSVEDFKNYVKSFLIRQNTQKAREKFRTEAFKQLSKKTKINLSNSLVTNEILKQKKQFEENLKKQGLTLAKYLKQTNSTAEKFVNQLGESAKQNLINSILFAEIAKLEKIKLTDQDYENEYKKYAQIYNQSEESIKKAVSKEQIQIPMTNDRVLDLLIKYNN